MNDVELTERLIALIREQAEIIREQANMLAQLNAVDTLGGRRAAAEENLREVTKEAKV